MKKINRSKLRYLFLLLIACIFIGAIHGQISKVEIVLSPQYGVPMQDVIQRAIDSCAALGGGKVTFNPGIYLSCSIQLKSKVTLNLTQGAVLLGSDKYEDYNPMHDAFIYGENITDISIIGEGSIDGADCYNPCGEEGFRGPHCIRLINCRNIQIKDVTIVRSGNYAINCRFCREVLIEGVKIRGGHDGLHSRYCDKFTVRNCDFRTGDDCFAGNGNRDFVITDCRINTSCNCFRLGCTNLLVERCLLWGPGEYMHRISNEKKLPSAFVHFAPEDEKINFPSANWVIRDIAVDSVNYFYMYNYQDGLWQTGSPVYDVTFENVKASSVSHAFYIADEKSQTSVTLKNCTFSGLAWKESIPAVFEDIPLQSEGFFYSQNVRSIDMNQVTFSWNGNDETFVCNGANKVKLYALLIINKTSNKPLLFRNIDRISAKNVLINGVSSVFYE